jgi:CRISPR system Cascade subunit CasA
MPQFDLIKEPWIPYLTNDGQGEMSLVDVLTQAHKIREILGDSPPVTIALHRLLLAILHRVYRGPQSSDEWKQMYDAGSFDEAKIRQYFEKFADRFDLFHATYPFYQTTAVRDKVDKGTVIKLYLHSSNNATLFDHTTVLNPRELSPAESARLLVMIQAFDTGGLITGDNGRDSAKAAPLIQSAIALIRGETLFETLMLNLHRYCGEDQAPFPFVEDEDLPAWERDQPTSRSSRQPDGPVDLLTWQSRSVLLKPEEDLSGKIVVRKSAVLAGYSFPDGMEIHRKETMIAFEKDNKGEVKPVCFNESRGLWRNSLSLFHTASSDAHRPRTFDWLSTLRAAGHFKRARLPVDFYGLVADKKPGKLLFWNHERFDLPLAYLEDEELVQNLSTCLDFSEAMGKAMGKALQCCVKTLAHQLGTKPNRFPTESNYWSQMELRFHLLLVELPKKGKNEMIDWFSDTERIAFDAFNHTIMSLSGTAAENKAAVKARNALRSAISGAKKGKATEWAPYLHERFEAKGGKQ